MDGSEVDGLNTVQTKEKVGGWDLFELRREHEPLTNTSVYPITYCAV